MIISIIGIATFILYRVILSFLDGYLILNATQQSSILWYLSTPLFFTIFVIILMIGSWPFRKRFISGIFYLFVTLLILFILKPVNNSLMLNGFRARVQNFIDLDAFANCSELIAKECKVIDDHIKSIHLKDIRLPDCYNAIFSNGFNKLPNLVLEKRQQYCFIKMEFEKYTLSYFPSDFPILKLEQSIVEVFWFTVNRGISS